MRSLKDLALNRLCSRVLEGAAALATADGGTSHERYLELFKYIEAKDGELAIAFNDLKRSNAVEKLYAMRYYGLITDEEFSCFSSQTQEIVLRLGEILRGE